MMNVIALLLLALAPQDLKTVVRQEKNEYNAAVAKCREAEAMIESDPSAAVERFTEIIALPRIRLMECALRIEQRPAEYSDPYNFLPYQYRGRARMNAARKASPENAQKLVALAIEDFAESVKRNVAPSAELQKNAEAALAKLKADVTKPPDPVKADPVAKFKEKWDPHMRAGRYKSAKGVIEKESEGLSEDEKKGFLQSTEQACRTQLINWASDFRFKFQQAMANGLGQMTKEEFDLLFTLPAPDELIVTSAALDWARQYQPAFAKVQAQEAPAHSLAAAAAAAAPLEEKIENPWFRSVEAPVFASIRNGISAEVQKAQDAVKADRDKARAAADALLKEWKGFTAKLDPKFAERHRFLADHDGQLTKLFDGFPMDLADLEKIDADLDAAFGAESPDSELAKIEQRLAGLESKSTTRESRARLYTSRITVAALRGLFSGKTEEAVAGDLTTFGQRLKDAGGAAGDVKKYGPRVEKVFAALR